MTTLLRQLEVTPEYWIPKVFCYKPNGSRHQGPLVAVWKLQQWSLQPNKLNPWFWSWWRTQCKLQVNCNVKTPTSCRLYYKSNRQTLYFLSESWGLYKGKYSDRAYAKKLWTQILDRKKKVSSTVSFRQQGFPR